MNAETAKEYIQAILGAACEQYETSAADKALAWLLDEHEKLMAISKIAKETLLGNEDYAFYDIKKIIDGEE